MSVNYFEKVRESVVSDITMAPKGRRNEALNLAAYALGRHAHMDAANIDSSVIDLHTAAKAIGLPDQEIKATIGSGFKRGSENPKQLDGDDAVPFQASEMDRLIARLASKELLIRDEETRAEKIAKAQEAWERSVPISRENKDAVRPALLYLNNRGMRAGTAAGVARYSPSIYGGPAIMFPATNEQGELCGVQSVLLTEDGQKREHNGINKYSRGSLVGNAMRVGDQHEGGAIILVEGPEDALSVRQAIADHADAAIVCTFGKAGMKTFNAPRASDVTICADPDLDVEAVADVLRGDGSTDVHVVRFDALGVENVKDANDYLQEAGAEKLREALALAKPVEEVKQERIASERQWPTPYEPVDPASIPARRWIYGQHYIRSNVSVLASAGGVGKTSLQILESLCITTGKPLLGEAVHERCNVWVINLEDPLEEMQRRYAATMLHYGIAAEEVRGRLFLDAGRSLNMVFANQGREGTEVNDEMLDYMAKMIKQNNIGVMFIDPWVGANMINENDNVAMNAAVSAVRSVCDETDCAAGLVHHIRKGNGDEATVDSVRGAGSLIGAARAARVINKISAEDAQKLGVSEDESLGIFRVDDGKANLAPPAAKAVYRRMVGVQLPNMEYVGVATEFSLPDLFEGITTRHTMAVQRMVGDAEANSEPLRESAQAKAWVGHAVAQVLDLDMEKKNEKAKVRDVIKKWLSSGVLRKAMAHSNRDGREVPCIVVGEWITGEEAGV